MPCDSTGGPSYQDTETYKEHHKMTVTLCDLMQWLELRKLIDASTPHSALVWWKKHQAKDKKRLKEEMRCAKEKADKDALLKQLTPYEKRLLHIRD